MAQPICQERLTDVIADLRRHPPRNLDEANRELNRLLATCPREGDGVHQWIWDVARFLWREPFELKGETILRCLREGVKDCGRLVSEHEIVDAVKNSSPDRRFSGRTSVQPRPPQQGQLPEPDAEAISAIFRRKEIRLSLPGLISESPTNVQDREPEDLLSSLYRDNPLLCLVFDPESSRGNIVYDMNDRKQFRRFPPFMIPNPVLGSAALTLDGKLSARALANVGARRYLVLDFDSGSSCEQATLIWHLKRQWANQTGLVLVLYTAGRGLHAWFDVRHLSEEEIWKLRCEARRLGACLSTLQNKAQLVRVPNAIRPENGQRQRVYFFDEAKIREET